MRILGIETSCDETGIAIYDKDQGLLAHSVYSQTDIHAEYGGVVPELASRDHVQKILPLIEEVFHFANVTPTDITGIAYTMGPGLNGALLVGATVGRSLGFAWGIPAIGVHHMEGHLLAPMLEKDPPNYPFIALLVSGGHTLLVKVEQIGSYDILGQSIDDAVGEAFDKTAKLLGLGYPGGAALAALAEKGDGTRFHFPRPMLDRPGLDFSFSGLKTRAANTIAAYPDAKADIARAFQDAVVETLTKKCQRAIETTGLKTVVVAGGVSANVALRSALQALPNIQVYFPRHEFCTDNGAMIAYAGCQRLLMGERASLRIEVRPRWPLSQVSF